MSELVTGEVITIVPLGLLCRVVVRRHPDWVGLLVVFLLRKLSWCLLVPWKLVLRKEAFWSVPVREEHTNWLSVQSKWSALKLYTYK